MLNFICKPFDQLTIEELHDLFALRSEVFVVEQDCVYQDIDGKDPRALHILGINSSKKIVGYARVLPRGESYSSFVSIGRVVVYEKNRGKNYGHDLLKKSIEEAVKMDAQSQIKISAQSHLVDFYSAHGFIISGEEYLEDGIPHITMILST